MQAYFVVSTSACIPIGSNAFPSILFHSNHGFPNKVAPIFLINMTKNIHTIFGHTITSTHSMETNHTGIIIHVHNASFEPGIYLLYFQKRSCYTQLTSLCFIYLKICVILYRGPQK